MSGHFDSAFGIGDLACLGLPGQKPKHWTAVYVEAVSFGPAGAVRYDVTPIDEEGHPLSDTLVLVDSDLVHLLPH